MIPLPRVAPAALALVILLTAAAKAQPYIHPPCPSAPEPKFEDHLQSLWYRRFWTGDCKDLPALGCRSGQPYWNDIVRALSARAPADQRKEVADRACRLGSRVGFEWTRPKTERRINSQDLKALSAKLEHAPDVSSGLSMVEESVREKIGRGDHVRRRASQ
jgi:hypothetical protein